MRFIILCAVFFSTPLILAQSRGGLLLRGEVPVVADIRAPAKNSPQQFRSLSSPQLRVEQIRREPASTVVRVTAP